MARRLQKQVAKSGGEPRVERQPEPVWYGRCNHWTEDWSTLTRSEGGIPLCPIDGAPGFHSDGDWWKQVDAYEAKGNPGYRAKVEAMRIGGRL